MFILDNIILNLNKIKFLLKHNNNFFLYYEKEITELKRQLKHKYYIKLYHRPILENYLYYSNVNINLKTQISIYKNIILFYKYCDLPYDIFLVILKYIKFPKSISSNYYANNKKKIYT